MGDRLLLPLDPFDGSWVMTSGKVLQVNEAAGTQALQRFADNSSIRSKRISPHSTADPALDVPGSRGARNRYPQDTRS